MIALFKGVFRGDLQRDGQAAALEGLAFGPDTASEDGAAADTGAAGGRRKRALPEPRIALDQVLAQKVLHGWLQNRHQTLFPLTVNLRNRDPGEVRLVVQALVLAALAGLGDRSGALERARTWLASIGADAAALQAFEAARVSPPATSTVLQAIGAAGLGATAYVAALSALDPRDPAASAFLAYLATRLSLPNTVIRSAARRYGR